MGMRMAGYLCLLLLATLSPASAQLQHELQLDVDPLHPQRIMQVLSKRLDTSQIVEFNRRDQTLLVRTSGIIDHSSVKVYKVNKLTDGTFAEAEEVKIKEIKQGNGEGYLVIKLDSSSSFFSLLKIRYGTAFVQSTQKIYYLKSSESYLSLSMALAIIYMILAFCMMCCNGKTFYHLVKVPQMLFLVSLIKTNPKDSSVQDILTGFQMNLFNIIPNPVRIAEYHTVHCQPFLNFFVSRLSCHTYNSLANYVLAFIIFFLMYVFLNLTKCQHIHFWDRIKDTVAPGIFLWTILPDLLVAIFLNSTAHVHNTALSFGMLFGIGIFFVLVALYHKYYSDYESSDPKAFVTSFEHFNIDLEGRLDTSTRQGWVFAALFAETLKVALKVTMVVLFHGYPATQLCVIFVAYILHAVFLVAARPYTTNAQNYWFAFSDLGFFILVLLMYLAHMQFDADTTEPKDSSLAVGMVIMVLWIYCANLIVFIPRFFKDFSSVTQR